MPLFLPLALLLAMPAMPRPVPPGRPGASRELPAEGLLRKARALRYAQRYWEAAAVYRAFLASHPDSGRAADARFWLAATLEQDQRWDEAAAAYSAFLGAHGDQRMLGREARLNRIRCWGIRQGQSPDATPGLLAALEDPDADVQVAAALQLAKRGERRGVPALQKGLAMPAYAEAASLALARLGEKPKAASPEAARFLVIRIQPEGGSEVKIRVALALARTVENYLSDSQVRQARSRGVDLANLTERAASMPKGSLLLSVEDPKSRVSVTVE